MLRFSAVCSQPPSEQLAPSSANSPRILAQPPYDSVVSYYLPLDLRRQPKHSDDNGAHGDISASPPTLRLVCIDAHARDCLADDNITDPGASLRGSVYGYSLLAPGRRNTPTDGKGSVTVQASLRSSHPNTNPIRISKGSAQRNAHRPQPYPGASTITKTTSTELCSKTKSYSIEIVQHPVKTAEFGDTTLTRLPLAPPLIARLVISGVSDAEAVDDPDLAFLVAQVSIQLNHASTPAEATAGYVGDSTTPRLLYGSLVSSPHILRNLQGRQGVYFLFPDVSVRVRGQYYLNVTLLRIPRPDSPEFWVGHRSGSALAQARSLPFDVLPREDYAAPVQTPLTQYFLQQGARMYAFASPPSSSYRG